MQQVQFTSEGKKTVDTSVKDNNFLLLPQSFIFNNHKTAVLKKNYSNSIEIKNLHIYSRDD